MIELLTIILLFIVNIFFTYLIKKMKNNVASGIDLVILGTMLSGYWFGWKVGFFMGMLFRFSVYVVTMEFDIGMIYSIPCVGIAGVIGAFSAFLGISLLWTSIITVFSYMTIYYSIRIFMIGDTNYVMMSLETFGLILVNIIIFSFFVN